MNNVVYIQIAMSFVNFPSFAPGFNSNCIGWRLYAEFRVYKIQ